MLTDIIDATTIISLIFSKKKKSLIDLKNKKKIRAKRLVKQNQKQKKNKNEIKKINITMAMVEEEEEAGKSNQ